jgi:hypothetical protein
MNWVSYLLAQTCAIYLASIAVDKMFGVLDTMCPKNTEFIILKGEDERLGLDSNASSKPKQPKKKGHSASCCVDAGKDESASSKPSEAMHRV